MQEANRLRAKSTSVEGQLAGFEVDFRSCRDALDRAVADKEQLQRQASSQLIDLDRLRQVSSLQKRRNTRETIANNRLITDYQEKDCLEMQYRVAERELNDLRDKLVNANRSISSATGNISSQESLICQLRGERLDELAARTLKGRLL